MIYELMTNAGKKFLLDVHELVKFLDFAKLLMHVTSIHLCNRLAGDIFWNSLCWVDPPHSIEAIKDISRLFLEVDYAGLPTLTM